MSKKKRVSKASKSKSDKEVSLQIYARVRRLMPWEPEKVSLKINGKSKVLNKNGKTTNEYTFSRVFKPKEDNKSCFHTIVLPMINNVLKGFNAVLIAYGQTGSGKTYSMLGKPKLGIVGLLPMMLEYLVKQSDVRSVELSAVEAFGHHIAKIYCFDLFDEDNQIKSWTEKKGNTGLDVINAKSVKIKSADDAHDKIIYAHGASHFAPTGKNPESSRGHVTFVSKVTKENNEDHTTSVSYFVMVDCAGSEGESAFTKQYISSVDKQTLMARRLEAGCINTGLSQLQIIFNELRLKGKLSNAIGNGLRRILHPFINTKTFLSVLFALSPSVTNCKPTEATLKFAVTAGMVKVSPIAAKKFIDLDQLVAELRKHIITQEQIIEENNDKAESIQNELNALKMDIIEAHEKAQQKKLELERLEKQANDKEKNDFMAEIMKQQKKENSNLSLAGLKIEEFEIEDDDDSSGTLSPNNNLAFSPNNAISPSFGGKKKHRTLTLSTSRTISLDIEAHERVQSEVPAVVQLQIAAFEKEQEDDAASLLTPMLDEYGDKMDPIQRIEIANKKGFEGMINFEENEKALKAAMKQNKKEQTVSVTQFARSISTAFNDDDDKKKNDDDNKEEKDNNNNNNNDNNMRVYDDEYSGEREDEYKRLKLIEYKKINDISELRNYADEQWLFYQQEVMMKKQLQQSQNIITDYLQDEMEGLLSYFRVRKILPKERIDIQW